MGQPPVGIEVENENMSLKLSGLEVMSMVDVLGQQREPMWHDAHTHVCICIELFKFRDCTQHRRFQLDTVFVVCILRVASTMAFRGAGKLATLDSEQ